MRSRAALAGITVACLWTSEARLVACTCAAGQPPCQTTWQAAAVFTGQVTSIADLRVDPDTLQSPNALWERRRVTFEIDEVFRGDVKDSVVVYTGFGDADCGYAFGVGSSYLVYAHRVPTGQLTAGICSRTRPVAQATEDLVYLRGGAKQSSTLGDISGVARIREDGQQNWSFQNAQGYQGGRVTIESTEPGKTARYEAATGPDGRYSVRVAPGRYRMSLAVTDGFYALPDVMLADIPDPRACAVTNFVVQSDARIGGRVRDSGGRPIGALSVELLDEAVSRRASYISVTRARTGSDGRFEFSRLAAGAYVLGLMLSRDVRPRQPPPPAAGPVWFSGPSIDPRPIRINPGERASAGDLTVPASIELTAIDGVVTKPDGTPAAGATVYVLAAPFSRVAASVPVDSGGRFTFTIVAGRSYRVSAELVTDRGQPGGIRRAESAEFTAAPGNLPAFSLNIR